ncbi:hypothetical protein SCP_1600910 [Sparassis crispa]|uniref:Uncharacterized protein n=1 Tax=Sparassis crispa TaxID=139825 RepID=A0A401H4X4_9APHY|nr:hypothetical protein SCP_1600910 [Sparassis crispa]GBE89429.1 hypothetical protein SCP_1600910 [Sparassis crispa]
MLRVSDFSRRQERWQRSRSDLRAFDIRVDDVDEAAFFRYRELSAPALAPAPEGIWTSEFGTGWRNPPVLPLLAGLHVSPFRTAPNRRRSCARPVSRAGPPKPCTTRRWSSCSSIAETPGWASTAPAHPSGRRSVCADGRHDHPGRRIFRGITVLGSAPYFYKVPATQELVDVVAYAEYPARETVVQRFTPPVPDYYWMNGRRPLTSCSIHCREAQLRVGGKFATGWARGGIAPISPR